MLKRIYRLPAGIRLQHPRTTASPIVIIKVSENKLGFCRFGFNITKKTAKSAVDRNRSKRLVRSCIEEELSGLKPGYDYLIIIRKNLADVGRVQVCEELKVLLKAEGLSVGNK